MQALLFHLPLAYQYPLLTTLTANHNIQCRTQYAYLWEYRKRDRMPQG